VLQLVLQEGLLLEIQRGLYLGLPFYATVFSTVRTLVVTYVCATASASVGTTIHITDMAYNRAIVLTLGKVRVITTVCATDMTLVCAFGILSVSA